MVKSRTHTCNWTYDSNKSILFGIQSIELKEVALYLDFVISSDTIFNGLLYYKSEYSSSAQLLNL